MNSGKISKIIQDRDVKIDKVITRHNWSVQIIRDAGHLLKIGKQLLK